jgi:alpha-tubulin suppressor-like RCC1 family protein
MRIIVSSFLVAALAACPAPVEPMPDGGSGGGSSQMMTGGGSAGGTAEVDAGQPPVAPETRLTQQPMAPVGPMTPVSFGFDCDVGPCTFECAFDAEPFTTCTTPTTRQGFTDGRHEFRVRASRMGLVDDTPASARFEVDAIPPTVSFALTPMNGQPTSRTVEFITSCDSSPCTLECSLDGAPFSACPFPLRIEGPSPGAHTLRVRGTDAVGNVGMPASHAFTLVFGWRSVAMVDNGVCAIAGDRTLHCWGSDNAGTLGQGPPMMMGGESSNASSPRPLRVGTDTDWDSIVSGQRFFCARKTSGATSCWGNNTRGLFGDPLPPRTATYTPTPVAHRFSLLSASQDSACGIDDMGALFCWGEGEFGVLGDGNLMPHAINSPQRVGTAVWQSVAVESHVCGVQADGSLWCFGRNNEGEVGLDPMTTPAVALPTRIGMDTDWAEVGVGDEFTCASKQSGEVFCFGRATDGVLGSSLPASTSVPTRVGTGLFRRLAVTTTGACAVTPTSGAVCWGQNEAGELGARVPFASTSAPVPVATTTPLERVLGRRRLRCAVTTNDGLECWGDNVSTNGGLGRGSSGGVTTLTAIDGPYRALAVSNAGGCGVSTDGGLSCWGTGVHLGPVDAGVVQTTPTPLGAATDWTSITVTALATPLMGPQSLNPNPFGHACGLRTGGQLFCWGRNTFGQLGQGSTLASFAPVVVPPPSGATWSQVAISEFSTCAIASTGRLYCWGSNAQGQIGLGTTGMPVTTPTAISNASTDWTSVALHSTRVIARRGNGTLWTWGGLVATPTAVDAATDWEEGLWVSNSWCGRKTSGAVWCKTGSTAASAVVGLTDAIKFARSQTQFCALRMNGSIACFNNTGTNWTIVSTTTPPTTLRSWEQAAGISCGLGLDDRRWCTGTRAKAQLGDGFDERVPAPVLTP